MFLKADTWFANGYENKWIMYDFRQMREAMIYDTRTWCTSMFECTFFYICKNGSTNSLDIGWH